MLTPTIKNTINSCILLLIATIAYAQKTVPYNQYRFTELDISPAFAGNHKDGMYTSTANQLEQTGYGEIALANIVAASVPIIHKSAGIGFIAKSDRYGYERNTETKALFSYNIKAWGGTVSFGAGASILFQSFSKNTATAKDLDDPLLKSRSTESSFNADAGLNYSSPFLTVAIACNNLLEDHAQFNTEKKNLYNRMLLKGLASYKQRLQRSVVWIPTLYTHSNTHTAMYADMSNIFEMSKKTWAGISFDSGKRIGFLIGCHVSKYINIEHPVSVGYMYKYGLSEYYKNSRGMHEISLMLQLRRRPNSREILDGGRAISPLTF